MDEQLEGRFRALSIIVNELLENMVEGGYELEQEKERGIPTGTERVALGGIVIDCEVMIGIR